ncbi:hypothetical protein EV426DRAFT_511719, partial [Tirmania nivea]
LVTLLLDQDADINLPCGGLYGTTLSTAVSSGYLEATLLLDRGADINLTFHGEYGTALAAAVASTFGSLKVAKLPLDRGA